MLLRLCGLKPIYYSLPLDKYKNASVVISVNKELQLSISLDYSINRTKKDKYNILRKDLLSLLTKIFYYYPNINVTDEKRQPYIVRDINEVYDHKGYPLIITRFNLKTLEDRKLYWDML